jgi:transcriptional regulator with XRE-family HTH domain
MGMKPDPVNRPGPAKELPSYSLKIREFRERIGLSQPAFGAKVKVRTGAVARWEGGSREPRTENFLALAELANSENLPEFAGAFLGYVEERKTDRQKEADDAEALYYLGSVESRAAAGNELAQYLLDLSRHDPKEFAKDQTKRIVEARQTLENGAYSAKLWEIIEEMHRVRKLFDGRQVRLARRFLNLCRRYERMEPLDAVLAKADRARKEKMGQVLDQMEAEVRAGKQSEMKNHLKRLLDANKIPMNALNAQKKVLDRLTTVESNLANLAAAWEKGEPVDALIDEIERALDAGPEPKESKERKKVKE